LATFLGTIPPCLLLFTGDIMNKNPPKGLCLTQSVLLDGIPPMLASAFLVLIFITWVNLRAMLSGTTSVMERVVWVKRLLLLAPYIALVSWCTASLVAALLEPTLLQRIDVNVYYPLIDLTLGNSLSMSSPSSLFSLRSSPKSAYLASYTPTLLARCSAPFPSRTTPAFSFC